MNPATPTSSPAHPAAGLGPSGCITCAIRATIRYCECGHPMVVHDIGKHGTRTKCTVHNGPKATPCGCRKYKEEA